MLKDDTNASQRRLVGLVDVLGDVRQWNSDAHVHESGARQRRYDVRRHQSAGMQHAGVPEYSCSSGWLILQLFMLHGQLLHCHFSGLCFRLLLQWGRL